jgi:hypothetical protein
MNFCTGCKKHHEGPASICVLCIPKNRAKVAAYQASNKAFIRSLKEKPCSLCTKSFEWYMMEWDHLDPSKKVVSISNAFRWSRARILAEVAKCRLLCIGCHRVHTSSGVTAGTKKSKNRSARERNHSFVNGVKAVPCQDCDKEFEPLFMDFDHVRGRKAIGISEACHRKWSISKIADEIAKCDIVCCWCHRRRTQSRLMNEAA